MHSDLSNVEKCHNAWIELAEAFATLIAEKLATTTTTFNYLNQPGATPTIDHPDLTNVEKDTTPSRGIPLDKKEKVDGRTMAGKKSKAGKAADGRTKEGKAAKVAAETKVIEDAVEAEATAKYNVGKARDALMDVIDAHGTAGASEVLDVFGIRKISELEPRTPDAYCKVMEACADYLKENA